tara:strand:+ start:190 stop:888 length:699 start_codon:yes stop_codon:yes gene_type:complete
MAAVIGSRDNLNRDPKKMGRFYNSSSQGGVVIPIGADGIRQLYTTFCSTNFWTTVTTASEIVANQSYTIYNVSGKSGFLIHAWTNPTEGTTAQNTVTFTVTVDGVASTIAFPQSNSPQYVSGWLGQTAGGRMSGNAFNNNNSADIPQSAMFAMATGNFGARILDNEVIDYANGSGSGIGMNYVQDLSAPMNNPLSCTRFENSLTVAYSTTVAIASGVSATRRTYGALIKLDD